MPTSRADPSSHSLAFILACAVLLSGASQAMGENVFFGRVLSAGKPVVGPDKIARMYIKLGTRASERARFEIRSINGLPAIVFDDPDPKPPNACGDFFALRHHRLLAYSKPSGGHCG